MIVSAYTHVGLVRESNEDNYLVLDLGPGVPGRLLAVADGMGGVEDGEVASAIAIETLRSRFGGRRTSGFNDPSGTGYPSYSHLLREAFDEANRRIYQHSLARLGHPGIGTTLTTLLYVEDSYHLAHIGDSRAYLVRNGTIKQLTDDHSLVGEMVKNGDLTEKEAMRHPHRNILTHALGTEERARVDVYEYEARPGDVVCLCTDGLTGVVGANEIKQVIAESEDLSTVARKLAQLANQRGGHDNVTVVVARIPP